MKEQEAVERLKCMRLFMQINDDSNDSKFLEDDYIANDMAIKALEKQIPKKVAEVDITEEDDFYYLSFMCPSCCMAVIGQPYRPKNCKHCGQKIDWSDEDDNS